MLEPHYREWRAIAAASGSTDRNLIQEAIGKLYVASGHKWPTFVWSESPRGLLTSLVTSLGCFGLVPLRDSLLQPLRLETSEVETRKSCSPMLWGLGTVPFEGFLDQQLALSWRRFRRHFET